MTGTRHFESLVAIGLVLGLALTGCTATSASGGRSSALGDVEVGRYSPAPAGAERPRVGCPPWEVKQARVEGDTVNTKTRPPGRGLWASDHGSVAATLQFR